LELDLYGGLRTAAGVYSVSAPVVTEIFYLSLKLDAHYVAEVYEGYRLTQFHTPIEFSWLNLTADSRPLLKNYTRCGVKYLIPGGLFDENHAAEYRRTSRVASGVRKRVQDHQNSEPAMCVNFHEAIVLESAGMVVLKTEPSDQPVL
jgi:hypothetical protein